MSIFFEMTYFSGHMHFKGDFQSVLCSLSTLILCLTGWNANDVIRNEPHTSSFSNSFIDFYITAAKLKSSGMRKDKPYSFRINNGG